MANIDFEKFTWFTPKPKIQLAITIPNQNYLNLNLKLIEQMPSRIAIGVSSNGTELCIQEQSEGGYKVPKSGAIKDKSLIQFIISRNVLLPVKYTVQREGDCWLAFMDEPTTPKINMKKPPRKPRSGNVRTLIKEIEAL